MEAFYDYYFKKVTEGWNEELIERYGGEVENDFKIYMHISKIREEWEALEENEKKKPKLIGQLIKPFGLNGWNKAEIGHDIYDVGDKYMIRLESDRYDPLEVTFYKETLNPSIKFMYINEEKEKRNS